MIGPDIEASDGLAYITYFEVRTRATQARDVGSTSLMGQCDADFHAATMPGSDSLKWSVSRLRVDENLELQLKVDKVGRSKGQEGKELL